MQGRVHLHDFAADEAPQACEWGAQTVISLSSRPQHLSTPEHDHTTNRDKRQKTAGCLRGRVRPAPAKGGAVRGWEADTNTRGDGRG